MTEGVEDFSEYVFEGISLGGLTEGDRASPWAAVQVDQRKPPESKCSLLSDPEPQDRSCYFLSHPPRHDG